MPDKPAESSHGFRLKISAKQGVMLGLLVAVLGYVMLSGDPKKNTDDAVVTTVENESAAVRRKSPTKSTPLVPLRRTEVILDQLVKQNPFAKLSGPSKAEAEKSIVALPPPVAEPKAPSKDELEAQKRAKERERRTQQALAELQGQKVKMILRTDTKTSAMIGNRLVTEGEVFEGIKVISILPQGVIVKRVSAQD